MSPDDAAFTAQPQPDGVSTAAELQELVGKFVDVRISELQRSGEIRADTTSIEVQKFRDLVVETTMGVFKGIDGLLDDLVAGSRTDAIRIISEYLKAIS
jgi:hypothetical protein